MRWIVTVALVLSAGPARAGDRAAEASAWVFLRFDRNADGKLAKEEVPERMRRFFERIDRNGDGFVTPEEDVEFRRSRARGTARGRSRPLPPGVKVLADLVYAEAGGETLRLDLYLPEKPPETRPEKPPETRSDKPSEKPGARKPRLLVWIHGGGWRRGDKARINPLFVRLVTAGYAAASINYRLSGLESHPAQIHDCKGAIRWLRAQADRYGYDARKIGVGGGSAGGHLALLLGVSGGAKELEGEVGGHLDRSSRVQAVVDLFGPVDIGRLRENARRKLPVDPAFARSASPLSYVTKGDPPILIFHGDQDPVVAPAQSKLLLERYRAAGLDASLHVIPGVGHGGPQFSDEARYALVKAFLDQHLR